MDKMVILIIIVVVLISIFSLIYTYIDNKRFDDQLVIIHIKRCLKYLREMKSCKDIDILHNNTDEVIKLLEFILKNNSKRKDETDEEETGK